MIKVKQKKKPSKTKSELKSLDKYKKLEMDSDNEMPYITSTESIDDDDDEDEEDNDDDEIGRGRGAIEDEEEEELILQYGGENDGVNSDDGDGDDDGDDDDDDDDDDMKFVDGRPLKYNTSNNSKKSAGRHSTKKMKTNKILTPFSDEAIAGTSLKGISSVIGGGGGYYNGGKLNLVYGNNRIPTEFINISMMIVNNLCKILNDKYLTKLLLREQRSVRNFFLVKTRYEDNFRTRGRRKGVDKYRKKRKDSPFPK